MREERANFRFLLTIAALLLVAVLASMLAFFSMVNAGTRTSSPSSNDAVALQVTDTPSTQKSTDSASASTSSRSSSGSSSVSSNTLASVYDDDEDYDEDED